MQMLVFQLLVIEKIVFELKDFHDHNYYVTSTMQSAPVFSFIKKGCILL